MIDVQYISTRGEAPAHTFTEALLAGLARDRQRLADLIGRAAQDGHPFNDVAVFRHRSEVIRAHL